MEKAAFLFPGQGSQYIGMGSSLYKEHAAARLVFEEASDLLGKDFAHICFSGSTVNLNKTEHMLLAIFLVSVATFRAYMEEVGQEPSYCAGHSLGEISALTCSGAIQFADAVHIVHQRSLLAERVADHGEGAMTVVNGIQENQIRNICEMSSRVGEPVSLACINSDVQFVIAGHYSAVGRAEDQIASIGGQITPLLMSPPFHSALMEEAAVELETVLKSYTFEKPRWPVIANATVSVYNEPDDIYRYLRMQLTQPVRWKETMDFLKQRQITKTIEMGPQSVLTNLVAANYPGVQSYSYGQADDRLHLLKKIGSGQGEIQGKSSVYSKESLVKRCLTAAVCTRNRNMNEEEFLAGVIGPYEQLEEIERKLEQDHSSVSQGDFLQVLQLLNTIFHTKKVPAAIQTMRFGQILEETGNQELADHLPFLQMRK
ncbi:ACP S-malonyltransferase [Paenibacillus lutrae]|uniref:[acyl-carrier-protein] S-malonyltransferase n=1 Tax=Paenibacillus lutrae TaxID=2078573 RepID=A0A7X3FFU7_9BACL|nr:ACP S-malonyltransferase [Paenibacillus lutrae]MVO98621.1 ACP S-malonyltransferase [Paenibacillus lutrae]